MGGHPAFVLGKQTPGTTDTRPPINVVEADTLDSLPARRRVDEMAITLVDGHVRGLAATQPKEKQIAGLQRVQGNRRGPPFQIPSRPGKPMNTRTLIAVDHETAAIESLLGSTAAVSIPYA